MLVNSRKATLLALGAVLSGFSLLAKPAQASSFCLDVWNPSCDIIPDTIIDAEIAPMTSFDIYLHNKTAQPIWVAARYYEDVPDRTDSTLGGGGVSTTHEWKTVGYWKVDPHKKVLVLDQLDDVVGRNIYFHAHSQNGGTWGDSDLTFNVNGENRSFFRTDMGGRFAEYTQDFN